MSHFSERIAEELGSMVTGHRRNDLHRDVGDLAHEFAVALRSLIKHEIAESIVPLRMAALKIAKPTWAHSEECSHHNCDEPGWCADGHVMPDDPDVEDCNSPGKKCECYVADVDALVALARGTATPEQVASCEGGRGDARRKTYWICAGGDGCVGSGVLGGPRPCPNCHRPCIETYGNGRPVEDGKYKTQVCVESYDTTKGASLRIYVAGGSDERLSVVRPMIERLGESGFVVTHDWTRCEGYDRKYTDDELRQWARLDADGVASADVVWVMTPVMRSEGAGTELGMAIVPGKHVIVSGPHARRNIFAMLATSIVNTHEEAFAEIVGLRALHRGINAWST